MIETTIESLLTALADCVEATSKTNKINIVRGRCQWWNALPVVSFQAGRVSAFCGGFRKSEQCFWAGSCFL